MNMAYVSGVFFYITTGIVCASAVLLFVGMAGMIGKKISPHEL